MNEGLDRPISIRRADGNEDAHDLYTLQEACLPSDTPSDVSRGFWWLAIDDDEPVGFAGLYKSAQWDDAVYLVRAGVMPAYRGRGIQKRLIRVRTAFAKKQGYRWAITETTFNPPSANSLIRCGFTTFRPSNPWSYKSAIYFRKRLL